MTNIRPRISVTCRGWCPGTKGSAKITLPWRREEIKQGSASDEAVY